MTGRTKSNLGLFFTVLVGVTAGFTIAYLPHPQKYIKTDTSSCPTDFHYSYFSTKSFYDKAYEKANKVPPRNSSIKGALVNHHLLAPHLIAETLNTVATDKPLTVVLVSPNHFYAGQSKIISSTYQWDTPYGTLQSDCETIMKLENNSILKIEETPFIKEHGISGIVPFIKKSLPHAKIIPLIVKDNLKQSDLEQFIETLHKTLGDNVLVIGSFDFSHYLSDVAAQFHDDKSLAVISNFDYIGLQTLDTDSIPGLEIVMKYMEKEGALQFNLLAHTNSSEVIRDSTIDETTSYINGTFSIGEKTKNDTATILAFGDMMLDRTVRKKMNENGNLYPFNFIKRFLIGSDIVVANAEGTFTNFPSVTMVAKSDILRFTFDPNLLPELKRLGFTLFSQANNHTLDFGEEGLEESENLIKENEIDWFGDPKNLKPHTFYKTIRGQKIAFVGYHQFSGQGFDTVINEIKSAKESDSFVIVYPHWGNEYEKEATQAQIKIGHAFIDAGADAVLGSHPHVIEPIEIYKNKVIFYSLGNFIFDQSSSGPTSEGLSVGLSITPKKVTYYLFPFDIKKSQAKLMSYEKRVKVLNEISENSTDLGWVKNGIIKGLFSLNR
ncbi:MAG: AmmeMemoRadiSam system protein B [Candidatus Taylorbacteria bacterium]|nr:AmmeMemoRadiSam system protein B [Candidatus Taylorbacteria bacterium]